MGSKSDTTDKTSNTDTTTVVDRKAVQQQGQQILDSLILDQSDKTVKEAMAGIASTFDTLTNGNTASINQIKSLADNLLSYINKGQVDISRFGLDALEKARQQLDVSQQNGAFLLKIADETTGKALTMAEQIARDQASAQRQALEIVADTKTGDYADLTRWVSGSVMAFVLAALVILRKGK